MVDYLQKGESMTGEYYSSLLTTTDLPRDYYLFPQLKKNLKGHTFSSHNEILEAVETCFEGREE